MTRFVLIMLLWLMTGPVKLVKHYTYPYGSGREAFSSEGMDQGSGGLYSFAVSPDGQQVFIPDAISRNIKIINLQDGKISVLNLPCPYDDIFIDSLWHIYFLSSGEQMIYVHSKQGNQLSHYPIPSSVMDDKFIIQGNRAFVHTQQGLWDIQSHKYAGQYYEAQINKSHLDLFLVKQSNPIQLLSVNIMSIGADQVYTYPAVEYIGRIGQYYVFYTYGLVFDSHPAQILLFDKEGNLIQHIAEPDDIFMTKHTCLTRHNWLYQVLFTQRGVEIFVYRFNVHQD